MELGVHVGWSSMEGKVPDLKGVPWGKRVDHGGRQIIIKTPTSKVFEEIFVLVGGQNSFV